MEEDIIIFLILGIIGVIVIGGTLLGINFILMKMVEWEEQQPKIIYECIDYNGELIYCDEVTNSYGIIYGFKDDGSVVKLNSCKEVEVKKDGK